MANDISRSADKFFIDLTSTVAVGAALSASIAMMLSDLSDMEQQRDVDEIMERTMPDLVISSASSDTDVFDGAFLLGRRSDAMGYPVFMLDVCDKQYFWVVLTGNEVARRIAASIYCVPASHVL